LTVAVFILSVIFVFVPIDQTVVPLPVIYQVPLPIVTVRILLPVEIKAPIVTLNPLASKVPMFTFSVLVEAIPRLSPREAVPDGLLIVMLFPLKFPFEVRTWLPVPTRLRVLVPTAHVMLEESVQFPESMWVVAVRVPVKPVKSTLLSVFAAAWVIVTVSEPAEMLMLGAFEALPPVLPFVKVRVPTEPL
jgi:hypothetical protein